MFQPQSVIRNIPCLSIFLLTLLLSANVHSSESTYKYLTEKEFDVAAQSGAAVASNSIQQYAEFRNTFERAIVCGQILVAEGDSWFNYPTRTDIVDALRDKQWAVFSDAHHGDTLEDMLYGNHQLGALYQLLEVIGIHKFQIDRFNEIANREGTDQRDCQYDVARNHYPKAILLSGGGNDVITREISFLLEHGKSSHIGVLNEEIVHGLFRRLNRILVEYLFAVSYVCRNVFNDAQNGDCSNVPIIVHGYDYVRASGDGFDWPGLRLRGPWLKPEFERKERLQDSDEAIGALIGRFNDLLCMVATRINSLSESERDGRNANPIIYVSFENDVGEGRWADELHPNRDAANSLAEVISEVILDYHNDGSVVPSCVRRGE